MLWKIRTKNLNQVFLSNSFIQTSFSLSIDGEFTILPLMLSEYSLLDWFHKLASGGLFFRTLKHVAYCLLSFGQLSRDVAEACRVAISLEAILKK